MTWTPTHANLILPMLNVQEKYDVSVLLFYDSPFGRNKVGRTKRQMIERTIDVMNH
jgi:hypothetical protein